MLYFRRATQEKQERFWSDLRKYLLHWQEHLARGRSLEHHTLLWGQLSPAGSPKAPSTADELQAFSQFLGFGA